MDSEKEVDDDPQQRAERPAGRLAQLATRHTTKRQRRVWSGRVASWDQHSSPGLASVTAAVLAAAAVRPDDVVLDLGCGTGQISIPLAMRGADVLGLDVSPAMADRLRSEARRRGLRTLTALALPVEELALPPASVDLVVSSYALHHLRDPDKARLITAAYSWLRPGGRIVIADMMFGRGGSPRDREIIRLKVMALARKGPGGWWRIAKNVARYLFRVHECPISMAAWSSLLHDAGFAGITTTGIVAEAGLISARRPGPPRLDSVRAAASRSGPR